MTTTRRSFRRLCGQAIAAGIWITACVASPPEPPRAPPPPRETRSAPSVAPSPPAPPPEAENVSEDDPEAPPEPAPREDVFDTTLPVEVPVTGDKTVLVAHGKRDNRQVIVYLHGLCGDVTKYRAFAAASVHYGTVIALRGDDKCDEPGRFKWGSGVDQTHVRILSAVSAVSAVRPVPLDPRPITLVGYSQGSARAEALVNMFPGRYKRAVLVAGPREHNPKSFQDALGIAIVAGEKDLKTHLSESAAKAQKAGVRAKYFELPGARHGEYGPEAVKVMGEALAWVFAPPPAP